MLFLAGQVSAGDSVEAVTFTGNHSFSAKVLASVATLKPAQPLMPGRLDNDGRLLEQFYQYNGFRQVRVEAGTKRGRRHWVVTFFVKEGPRAKVGRVSLTGVGSFAASRLLGVMPTRTGISYAGDLPARGAEALRSFYLNRGFPFVEVEAAVEFTDTVAALAYSVVEGPRCHVGGIRVRGNRAVKAATVVRATELHEGELFSQQRLQEARSRLYATRLFQRVLYVILRPDSLSDSVVVRLDVVEQPHRVFSFGAGFEVPPLRLLLSGGWEHANVLNRGHQLETDIEFSPDFAGDYRLSVDATYRMPYLILTRIDLFTNPFLSWDVVDTVTYREFGIESGLSRNLLTRLRVGLTNRFRLIADTSTGITNALGVNVQYESMDDIFDPTSGVWLRGVAETAGWVLMGDNDFNRVTGEGRLYQSVPFGCVAAARVMAGRVFGYRRTPEVPWYESFQLGGRNSIRGYGDRSLGPDSTDAGERYGPIVFNANVELRSPYVLDWVGVVGFFDCGDVVSAAAGLRPADFAISAGVGVRVRTPIGPVRLDWGKRLRDAPAGDRGRLYLGLLHAF